MKKFTAFAPGNISCIFQIHEDPDPAQMGSRGLGFTLDKGVTVEVSLGDKTEIFFNGEKITFPTVESVLRKIITHEAYDIRIEISSELQLGGGFGLSGASALATAYALNELLDLKKEKLELAKIAHVAEVENKTGLGDVTNQYFGGCLLKIVQSSKFKVKSLPVENMPVYCKVFSKLLTKSVITNENMREKINQAAIESIKKIQKRIRNYESRQPARQARIMKEIEKKSLFADLISISKEFAEDSGLLQDQEVIKTIQDIESRGGHASMIMLGNGVFSDIPFDGAEKFFLSR